MCTHLSSCACWRMPSNPIVTHPHTHPHTLIPHTWQVNDKVLHRKQAKFQSWHSRWLTSNLTTQESTLCMDWLLGKVLLQSPEDNSAVTTESSPLTECTKELYLGVERSRYITHPRKQPPPSTSTVGPTEPPEPMSTD